MKLFRWLKHHLFGTLPAAHICCIPQGQALLCEVCHHFVSIPGFIPALVGDGVACPRCYNRDPDKLKLVITRLRTDSEQEVHIEKRTRKGWVRPINGGIPRVLQRKTDQVEEPKGAA